MQALRPHTASAQGLRGLVKVRIARTAVSKFIWAAEEVACSVQVFSSSGELVDRVTPEAGSGRLDSLNRLSPAFGRAETHGPPSAVRKSSAQRR